LQYSAKSAYNILQVDAVAVTPLSSCSGAGPSAKEASVCITSTAMQSLQDENMALRNTLQEMSRLALPSELATEQPFQVKVNAISPYPLQCLLAQQHAKSAANTPQIAVMACS